MKTKQRQARRAIIAITLAMIMCMMTAVPAAAGQRFPYLKATGTDGYWVDEWAGMRGVLLESEHFRGMYWTRRASDGWLTLQKLSDDPIAAGQVFIFNRDLQTKDPSSPYGVQWIKGSWHEISCAQSTYSWLEVKQDGFYFGKYKTRDVTSGVVNVPEQLWRIRVIRDEGAYQVIRLSSMTKNGAAAAGWGEAIPHEWVEE